MSNDPLDIARKIGHKSAKSAGKGGARRPSDDETPFHTSEGVSDETLNQAPPPEPGPEAEPEPGDDIEDMDLPESGPWPVMREEAYHGIVGEIIRTIAPESEADPVGLLISMLVAAGNAIGRTAHAVVESDKHHCNLFVITVGKSGHGRKGTALGRVKKMMGYGDPGWLADNIASGMSSGEGLIARVRDPQYEMDEHGEPNVIVPGVTDKRLLVVETEFGQVLRNLKRETNTLSSIIRNAWDGNDIATLTKMALKATGAHISIIAHVTEAELNQYFIGSDLFNGFANRFLWPLVKRSKLLPHGGRRLDLSRLGLHLAGALAGAKQLDVLEHSPDTAILWEREYERLTNGRQGMGGVVTSRAEAQTLRLSTLFAALDASHVIMPEHLHAALAVWDYCEESAMVIFGSEERLDKLTASILRELEAAGEKGMTRTDIRNALNRNEKSADIVASLGKLLERKLARFEKQHTGGKKPAERWFAITRKRGSRP